MGAAGSSLEALQTTQKIIAPAEAPSRATGNVVNLMEALKHSIGDTAKPKTPSGSKKRA